MAVEVGENDAFTVLRATNTTENTMSANYSTAKNAMTSMPTPDWSCPVFTAIFKSLLFGLLIAHRLFASVGTSTRCGTPNWTSRGQLSKDRPRTWRESLPRRRSRGRHAPNGRPSERPRRMQSARADSSTGQHRVALAGIAYE